jgi:hypothetical protein
MTDARFSFSPGLGVALLALLLALGGSAFAVGDRVSGSSATQQRCAQGAVRGIAVVAGDPRVGMANLPDRFTASPAVFGRRFNCTGRAVQVRRAGIGLYEIRFLGNGATTALAGGLGGGAASVDPARNGIFRVSVTPAGRADPEDRGFTIVLF